jgi:hypothetical protein
MLVFDHPQGFRPLERPSSAMAASGASKVEADASSYAVGDPRAPQPQYLRPEVHWLLRDETHDRLLESFEWVFSNGGIVVGRMLVVIANGEGLGVARGRRR